MVRCPELPEIAAEQIVRTARGRSIPGTNKFARVCRQWRDVSEDNEEPLQLFINVSHLSEKEVPRAIGWLSTHGRHVDVLAVHVAPVQVPYGLSGLVSAAPAFTHLKQLEVSEQHSLPRLAPVLQQLPQLQHLAAGVSLVCGCAGKRCRCTYAYTARPCRIFVTPSPTGLAHWAAPGMQELCPQLTSLHLTVHLIEGGSTGKGMDPHLSRLLSPRLQQLTLAQQHGSRYDWGMRASSLAHLSALQQLTLDGLALAEPEARALCRGLGALQQVRVYRPAACLRGAADVAQLAPLLSQLEIRVQEGPDVGVLSSCVHLSRLVLSGGCPVGVAGALASLTALRDLGLVVGDGGSRDVAVVQQAAGMAQLRSLQLDSRWCKQPSELAVRLAQCTQLTSLVLRVEVNGSGGDDPWVSALQQLVGLQRLTVSEQRVARDEGGWLVPLTALTCLCIEMSEGFMRPQAMGWRSLSSGQQQQHLMSECQGKAQQVIGRLQLQLQPWPAGLRQLVFWACHKQVTDGFKPMWWQFTPSAPGSSAQVAAWLERQDRCAPGWARPLRPCPHLPGVCELQGSAQGRPWHLVQPAV